MHNYKHFENHNDLLDDVHDDLNDDLHKALQIELHNNFHDAFYNKLQIDFAKKNLKKELHNTHIKIYIDLNNNFIMAFKLNSYI